MVCRIRPLLIVALAVCCSFEIGCGKGSSDSTKSSKERVADELSVPGPQSEPEPELPPSTKVKAIDRAGLDAVIAKHSGRVVLVDYWATWCGPCRKKFPHTVALAKEHKAEGLSVIGVSMDDEEALSEVEQFLAENNAEFENFRAKGGASDESFEEFEIPDGALPCLRLFDRTATLVKTFAIDVNAEKQFTAQDVADAIKELLAK